MTEKPIPECARALAREICDHRGPETVAQQVERATGLIQKELQSRLDAEIAAAYGVAAQANCPFCAGPSENNPGYIKTPVCWCEEFRVWGDPPPNHKRYAHHHYENASRKYIVKCEGEHIRSRTPAHAHAALIARDAEIIDRFEDALLLEIEGTGDAGRPKLTKAIAEIERKARLDEATAAYMHAIEKLNHAANACISSGHTMRGQMLTALQKELAHLLTERIAALEKPAAGQSTESTP